MRSTNSPVIRVAWTFDDGPFPCTGELIDQLNAHNILNVTWFVARHRVHQNNYFKYLYQLQQSGSEIAIHEIHRFEDAVNWFPQSNNCFPGIREAIEALKEYYCELHLNEIMPRFVRLPGGEITELIQYLKVLHCPADLCNQIAVDIINGKQVPAQYQAAREDFDYFLLSLQQLNLTVWSGAPKGCRLLGGCNPYHYNSWQAECAGVAEGRGADNITLHQAPERKLAGIIEPNGGVFEQKVEAALATGESQSVVILAHDRTPEDIVEIMADIDMMKACCDRHTIDLHFCTLSQLFNAIRS